MYCPQLSVRVQTLPPETAEELNAPVIGQEESQLLAVVIAVCVAEVVIVAAGVLGQLEPGAPPVHVTVPQH